MRTALVLVAILALYAAVGTMDYNIELAMQGGY
jgi:hypothetical protein